MLVIEREISSLMISKLYTLNEKWEWKGRRRKGSEDWEVTCHATFFSCTELLLMAYYQGGAPLKSGGPSHLKVKVVPRPPWPNFFFIYNNLKKFICLPFKKNLETLSAFFYANKIKFYSIICSIFSGWMIAWLCIGVFTKPHKPQKPHQNCPQNGITALYRK